MKVPLSLFLLCSSCFAQESLTTFNNEFLPTLKAWHALRSKRTTGTLNAATYAAEKKAFKEFKKAVKKTIQQIEFEYRQELPKLEGNDEFDADKGRVPSKPVELDGTRGRNGPSSSRNMPVLR